MIEFARTVPAPKDLGTAVIGIPEGADLAVALRLESVTEGVLVSGVVRGTAVGECVRCLGTVTQSITARLAELFAYPERVTAARESGDEEFDDVESMLEDELADLEPAIRDLVVTALPFRPLCCPDCPGLCSECGAELAAEPDHKHDLVDPRWSALAALLDVSEADSTKKKES